MAKPVETGVMSDRKRGRLVSSKAEACRTLRKKLIKDWRTNVAYRKGEPLEVAPQSDVVTVPVDWSRTKNKQGQLFFQVPDIKLKARNPQVVGAQAVSAAALKFELDKKIRIQYTMDEMLADVINAAGFCACVVGYEGHYDEQQIPLQDTALMPPDQAAAAAQQTVPVPGEVYSCRFVKRISPSNFIWDVSFKGSDWSQCDLLGYDDKCPLADAIRNKWVTPDYEGEAGDEMDSLNEENDSRDYRTVGRYVKYTRIFYRMSAFDPTEMDPRKIGHMVFVDGKKDPVVDEPLKWQKYDPNTGQWIGLRSNPITVMTLTTVSDDAIPPSDSKIGRPQVKELNRSRTQMLQQRDRSQPLRWFDVNRVDDEIVEQMRKGIYQDMIPMNGPGDTAIGEVARAAYPRESNMIMQVIEHDLDQAWSAGPNQNGYESQQPQSATAAKYTQQSFSVAQEYEQGKVLRFFVEIAEKVFNLMQMFQTQQEWVSVLGPDRVAKLQPWSASAIAGDFLFEVKPDAAQRIDMSQKRQEKLAVYKIGRRDSLINPAPLVADLMETFGYDPTEIMAPPQPPPPDKGNFRFSFKGEDMTNPIVLAIVLKGDPQITPNDIEAAKQLLNDVGFPPVAALPQHGTSGTPAQGAPPPGPPGMTPPMGALAPPKPTLPAGPAGPAPRPPLNTGHGGPTGDVTPLNQRYERDGGGAAPKM